MQSEQFVEKQKERVRRSARIRGKINTVAECLSGAAHGCPRWLSQSERDLDGPGHEDTFADCPSCPWCTLRGFIFGAPSLVLAVALLAGILLPEFWILWRVQVRQQRLRRALPDALDLLVICVEAGLGLDQAFIRVAQEMRVVHPELSDELQQVTFEMRIGKSRLEALRDLSRRSGIDDIKALVAMLAQTERFGTSIAQSLRVHSDEMRTRRRQRAEGDERKDHHQNGAAAGFLVYFFPALMVVVIGLRVADSLPPVHQRQMMVPTVEKQDLEEKENTNG